jgi:GntR family transcriptional repressor for pyruvate dehydrogenase complex
MLSDEPQLRPPRLADRVVVDLSERIRTRVLKAGERIPTEQELMRQYRVSRAVVREAISRLQATGLVEARQGIGTFVQPTLPGESSRADRATVLTTKDAIAVIELRIALESEAASLAAQRRTDEQLHAIQKAVDEIQRLLDSGAEQTAKEDFDFHQAVAAAAGNQYFPWVLSSLGIAILPRTRIDLRYVTKESAYEYLNRSNSEHRAILTGIAQKDVHAAREAMTVHLMNSRDRLQKLAVGS